MMRWLILCFIPCLIVGCGVDAPDKVLPPLSWTLFEDLPGGLGVAGPFAGASNGALIVAGGANFPLPVWDGQKEWLDAIHVFQPGIGWHDGGKLPQRTAYGASVSLEEGVLCIGGRDGDRCLDTVFLLQWDQNAGRTTIDRDWPDLPQPLAHLAACHIRNARVDAVFIVTGQVEAGLESASRAFWKLDLTLRGHEEFGWQKLDEFPGPARSFAVAAVQNNGRDDCLYLTSGRRYDDNRQHVLLNDHWEYNPRTDGWRKRADAPHCVMAGVAIPLGASHVAVISGDDGGNFGRADELRDNHPGFFNEGLLYHTITDSWTSGGPLPGNQVTTTAVPWETGFLVPSGETRPRVRTTRIWMTGGAARQASLNSADYTVIGLYLLSLLVMGIWFAGRGRGTGDFFLAGRRIPAWAAGISLFGTQLSAITFMAIPAHVYANNWVYFLGSMMIVVGAPIVVRCYLPFFRRLNVTTAYEYLELRFNLATRLLGSSAFILFQLGRMSVVLYLPALAMATVTGFDIYLCIIVMGFLATIYTTLGGIEAVIWTDVLQVIVLVGGALVSLFVIVNGVDGGWSGMFDSALSEGKLQVLDPGWSAATTALWVVIVGRLFDMLIPYTSDQTVVQRYLTTATEGRAARAIWTNALLTIPASLLFFGIGTGLWAFYRSHPESLNPTGRAGDIFPWFIATELPAGFSGLVIAGLFAASMSSLDSSINSISTVLTTDFYRRFRPDSDDAVCLRLARRLTVLLGVVGTGCALYMAAIQSSSMWDTYSRVVGLFGSGLAGLFLAGVFTRRIGAAGVLTGFAVSAVVLGMVRFHAADSIHFFLYPAIGVTTCVVSAWVVSLFGSPPSDVRPGLTVHDLH